MTVIPVAGVYSANGNITIYEGNQEVCRNQGCLGSPNQTARQLYQTTLALRSFFLLKFGLWGIDTKGEIPPLQIGWQQNNAQWTCSSSLAHSCFFRFHNQYAVQPKVVAHEYTHGIIARLRPLNYQNQSGALNESLADIFGIVFNYWYQGDPSWQIAGRNLSQYVNTSQSLLPYATYPNQSNDYGNVHSNSCIPSHAFYIAAHLIGEPRDGKVTQIWFQAFLLVDPNETFDLFAYKTINQAYSLYNLDTAAAIWKAWVDVGVLQNYILPPIQERQYTSTNDDEEDLVDYGGYLNLSSTISTRRF